MCTEVKLFGRRTLLNKITNDMTAGEYHLERLSVLPVVGPPGIGKTTLIQTLCNDPRIQEHFSIIIWISVSLNFSVHRLSQEIFRCIPPTESDGRSRAQEPTNLDQLQKLIEKRLKSKRFLVVLDDMWTCKSELDWRTLLAPLTKAELDGNMIIVTTRFQSIAELVKTTNPVTLAGLEPKEFWKFFLACIFDDYRTKQDEGLLQIGRKIVEKLKCSPLAARTVGRLLKKDLTQQHWIRVLQRKEWEYQKGDDDIMPALRISYYYLPFHLKKCFEFCALFPEDYEFDGLELINMWMVLGMIDSNGTNTSIEQVGLEYLNTLVDSGIFSKVNKEAYSYYSVHDLFHELATCISSHECIRIDCSNVRCESIQSAVRHISFVTQDSNTYSEGSEFYENIRKEIGKLKQTVDVGNLRTVLFIGKFNAIFDKIFEDIS
jgi:energy-coupling factor transporter ATP-binding protein EcfA2